MPYTQPITPQEPTCVLLLLDQSLSMRDPVGAQPGPTKAVSAAGLVNQLLEQLLLRSTRSALDIRDYFVVGVVGYGSSVTTALQVPGRDPSVVPPLLPMSVLPDAVIQLDLRQRTRPDGAGGYLTVQEPVPIYVEPAPLGSLPDAPRPGLPPHAESTLMCEALQVAYAILEPWITAHPTSFPPLVVHITDGMASDGNPLPAAEALRGLATRDGNVLLFHCHLSTNPAPAVLFPDSDWPLPDEYAHQLFVMSSLLPGPWHDAARARGYSITPTSRGFTFNSPLGDLAQFFPLDAAPMRAAPSSNSPLGDLAQFFPLDAAPMRAARSPDPDPFFVLDSGPVLAATTPERIITRPPLPGWGDQPAIPPIGPGLRPALPAGPQWPTAAHYSRAIQRPVTCFADPLLRTGRLRRPNADQSVPCVGSAGCVYPIEASAQSWAVKCFLQESATRAMRYTAIAAHLQAYPSPFLVPCQYLAPQGMLVEGTWYPVLRMEWVLGLPLDRFVADQLASPAHLTALADSWARAMEALEERSIVHGDLDPSNVLVHARNGEITLRIVDYDDMSVPSSPAAPAAALHPAALSGPSGARLSPASDHSAALAIYLSLRALALRPDLWPQFHGDGYLLFQRQDFADPGTSRLFATLRTLSDPHLLALCDELAQALLHNAAGRLPSLHHLLTGAPASLLASGPLAGPPPASISPSAPIPARPTEDRARAMRMMRRQPPPRRRGESPTRAILSLERREASALDSPAAGVWLALQIEVPSGARFAAVVSAEHTGDDLLRELIARAVIPVGGPDLEYRLALGAAREPLDWDRTLAEASIANPTTLYVLRYRASSGEPWGAWPIRLRFTQVHGNQTCEELLPEDLPVSAVVQRLVRLAFLPPLRPGQDYLLVLTRTHQRLLPEQTLGAGGVVDGDVLEAGVVVRGRGRGLSVPLPPSVSTPWSATSSPPGAPSPAPRRWRLRLPGRFPWRAASRPVAPVLSSLPLPSRQQTRRAEPAAPARIEPGAEVLAPTGVPANRAFALRAALFQIVQRVRSLRSRCKSGAARRGPNPPAPFQ